MRGQQQFTDQIGLITAAFYRIDAPPAPSPPGGGERPRDVVGTDLGKQQQANLTEVVALLGEMLAVVHIHYVEPNDLYEVRK